MKANRAEESERFFLFIENTGPAGLQVSAQRGSGLCPALRSHCWAPGRGGESGADGAGAPPVLCPHVGTWERDGEALRGAGLHPFPVDTDEKSFGPLSRAQREAAAPRNRPASLLPLFPYVRVIFPHAFETSPTPKPRSGAAPRPGQSSEDTSVGRERRKVTNSAQREREQ